VEEVMDVYFTAHAFSSSYSSTWVEGFCCTINWGAGEFWRHLFLIKTTSSLNLINKVKLFNNHFILDNLQTCHDTMQM
jgi:hypothetical protein